MIPLSSPTPLTPPLFLLIETFFLLATGAEPAGFSLKTSEKGLYIEYETFQTSRAGVFAGGDALMPLKQTVRSVVDGRSISQSIDSFLKYGKPELPEKIFDSRSGVVGCGITTRTAVQFDDPLGEGLNKSAEECIEACPTGALSWIHRHIIP